MKHILLTGATGFLGSHLLEALLRQGYPVTILKRSSSDTWRIKHLLDSVAAYDVDVQPMEEAFKPKKVDAVIHLACVYGKNSESVSGVYDSNVVFPLRIAEIAAEYGAHAFINTDTFFVKSNLLNAYMAPYVTSKKHIWECLMSFFPLLKIVNMRLEHVYGPNDNEDKFVEWLSDQYVKCTKGRRKVQLSSCMQIRDFVSVYDVVNAYGKVLSNLDKIESGTVYEVGSGIGTTVKEFVINLHKFFSDLNYTSVELEFDSSRDRKGEMRRSVGDNHELKKIGWMPEIDLNSGISKLVTSKIRCHEKSI
jgi:CDP-paratose synthetase